MSDNNLALLLLTLLYSEGKIEGRKRFQKIVCILKYQHDIPFKYEFVPYFYGPYADELANSLNILVSSGLVDENKSPVSETFSQYVYELTSQGKELATNLSKESEDIDFDLFHHFSQEVACLKHIDTSDLVKRSKKVSKMYDQ
jgi:uncharacterized protein YwgA